MILTPTRFNASATPAPTAASAATSPAASTFSLINLSGGESFEFIFPPSIDTEEAANYRAQDTTIGVQPLYFANRSPGELSPGTLLLDRSARRESIKPEIDALRLLMREGGTSGAGKSRLRGEPPLLLATWGDEEFVGVLVRLNVRRTQFLAGGEPCRAEGTLTLQQSETNAQVRERSVTR